jgi:hypothetical protein
MFSNRNWAEYVVSDEEDDPTRGCWCTSKEQQGGEEGVEALESLLDPKACLSWVQFFDLERGEGGVKPTGAHWAMGDPFARTRARDMGTSGGDDLSLFDPNIILIVTAPDMKETIRLRGEGAFIGVQIEDTLSPVVCHHWPGSLLTEWVKSKIRVRQIRQRGAATRRSLRGTSTTTADPIHEEGTDFS